MKYRKFSPEFREEAAWMVVEISRPIADVVRELGRPAERQAIPMIAARGARLGRGRHPNLASGAAV
jgi:hypothetical protein